MELQDPFPSVIYVILKNIASYENSRIIVDFAFFIKIH